MIVIVPAGEIHSEKISCEIQTRTIFEEAWSEIDHKVRYPSFSEDPHLKQFLNIFNRLAGSADEMGSYVIQLVRFIKESDAQNEKIEKSQNQIKELQMQLSNLIEQNKDYEEVKKVNVRLKKLIAESEKFVTRNKIGTFGNAEIKIDNNDHVPPTSIAALIAMGLIGKPSEN